MPVGTNAIGGTEAYPKGLFTKLDGIVDRFSCGLPLAGKEKNVNAEQIECLQQYQNDPKLRLIRARLIAAATARYAAARIADYSFDKANDATKVLGQLERVTKLLDDGYAVLAKDAEIDKAMYPTQRADMYVAFIHLIHAATNPAQKKLTGLVVATPLERIQSGEQIFMKMLEDGLYLEAYADDMMKIRIGYTSIPQSITLSDAWNKGINSQMKSSCGLLVVLTGTKATDTDKCNFIKDQQ